MLGRVDLECGGALPQTWSEREAQTDCERGESQGERARERGRRERQTPAVLYQWQRIHEFERLICAFH